MQSSTKEPESVGMADADHPPHQLAVMQVASPMVATDKRKELVTQESVATGDGN